MNSRDFLAPDYYGQPSPSLHSAAESHWEVNQPNLEAFDATQIELAATEKMARMVPIYAGIADWTFRTIQDGDRAISLAGDCSSCPGVLTRVANAGISPTLLAD